MPKKKSLACFLLLPIALSLFTGGQALARRARRRSLAMSKDRLQRILVIEDHRLSKTTYLLSSLRSADKATAKAAALALANVGDPSGLAEMAKILNGRDRELKVWTTFALGVIGGDTALKILTQQLPMQTDSTVLAEIYPAIGRAGNDKHQQLFADALREDNKQPGLYEPAARGLGMLWSKDGADKWGPPPVGLLNRLAKLSIGDSPTAVSAAFALSRFKGDLKQLPAAELLQAASQTTSPDARAFLLRVLARTGANGAVALFDRATNDTALNVRVEAAAGLGEMEPSLLVQAALRRMMKDRATSVVANVLDAIDKHAAADVAIVDGVAALYSTTPSNWIRGKALTTLARLHSPNVPLETARLLASPSSPLFPYALLAMGITAQPGDIQRLDSYAHSQDPLLAEKALEAIDELPESAFTPDLKVTLRNLLQRGDVALGTHTAMLVDKFKWKDFVPFLAASYSLLTPPDDVEPKVAILNTLGDIGDHSVVELLEGALSDPDHQVILAAAAALKNITGRDDSSRLPTNSIVTEITPKASEALAAVKENVVLITDRGSIHLRMLPEAPLTALNFIRLVKKGFYQGKTFHRLVPGFVVQGGDPRGDGYGGPGYSIRDEVSPVSHTRGVVGMATAGKDTGGSQFFINLAPNFHLDGRYTAFAEVTSGIDVVETLEPGDHIISARALGAR